jgi:phasin family protein
MQTTDQSDIRALMQIVTSALEHEASARIVVRDLCLSEKEIDRLYELAERPQTLQFVRVLWARYPFVTQERGGARLKNIEEHERFLMLIEAGNRAGAVEAMVAHISDVTKKSFDEASTIAKSMSGAKTPNEMMQLQTDFAKAQYDSAVAEFSKMTEMMVKLSGEAMEPMQNRIALATDKMKTLFNK